jgi:hypothetical protein
VTDRPRQEILTNRKPDVRKVGLSAYFPHICHPICLNFSTVVMASSEGGIWTINRKAIDPMNVLAVSGIAVFGLVFFEGVTLFHWECAAASVQCAISN